MWVIERACTNVSWNVEKMGIEKGFNAVFQFNVKKGTRGYVLDGSRRYISHD